MFIEFWYFNNYARNVVIFGADNSSSYNTDNRKNSFSMLSVGPTSGINGRFGSAEKKFSVEFNKAKKKFCLSLNYSHDNSYLFVNGQEIFKAHDKTVNFQTQFCLGSISNEFRPTESREVSLKGNIYSFQVDYSAIDKSERLNIYKYLMIKNDMK